MVIHTDSNFDSLDIQTSLTRDELMFGVPSAGLYGHLVPQTVANFLKAVKAGIYTGTLWSKVLPGEYIQAGQQGSRRTGAVDFQKPGQVLSRNQEVLSSNSFRSAV